jgi:hypothetical protein
LAASHLTPLSRIQHRRFPAIQVFWNSDAMADAARTLIHPAVRARIEIFERCGPADDLHMNRDTSTAAAALHKECVATCWNIAACLTSASPPADVGRTIAVIDTISGQVYCAGLTGLLMTAPKIANVE